MDWDLDILRDVFIQEDVDRIIRIPVSNSRQGDKWMWMEDSKGQYTVKSGYRVLNRSFAQLQSGGLFKWLRLWSLSIPPKTKNFIWRVLHDCIPTLDNLRRKHVDVHPICKVCKLSVETLDHILISCHFASRCWEISNLQAVLDSDRSIFQRIVGLFDSLDLKVLEVCCSILWSLWNHRNSVVWDNKYKTCVQVLNEASSSIFQWQQAQVTQNRISACFHREGMLVWQPPPTGWKTCSVDAAFCEKENKSAYGFVLRDDHGNFVAGCGGRLLGALDVRVAEALAFREALSWLKNLAYQDVYVELDSLVVVEAVRSKTSDNSYFGTVIVDCLEILKDLRSIGVYFIRRSANLAAHAIARVASSMSGHEEWFSAPSFLIDVLVKDLIC